MECLPQSSGKYALSRLDSGALDFAVLSSTALVEAVSRGVDVQVIYFGNPITSAEGLVVNPDVPGLFGLEGRTIAAPFQSTTHIQLLHLITLLGVNVKVVDMASSNMMSAMASGEIDGAFIWDSTKGKLIAAGAVNVLDSSTVALWGLPTFNAIAVRGALVRERPDVVAHFVRTVAMLDQSWLESGAEWSYNAGRHSFLASVTDALGAHKNASSAEQRRASRQDLANFLFADSGEQLCLLYSLSPDAADWCASSALFFDFASAVAKTASKQFLIKLTTAEVPVGLHWPLVPGAAVLTTASSAGGSSSTGGILGVPEAEREALLRLQFRNHVNGSFLADVLQNGLGEVSDLASSPWAYPGAAATPPSGGAMGGDSNCTHLRVKRFAAGTIGDSPATKGSFGDGALGAGGSYDDSLTCMWVITASDHEDDDEAGGSSSSVVRLVVDGLRLWSHDSLRVFSGDLTALAPRSSSLTGLGSSNTVVDPTIDYSLATSPEMANQDDDSGSGSDARVGVLLAHLTGYDEVWPPLESTTGSMTVVLQTDGVADRSYNERFGDGFQASFDAGVNATFKGRNCTSDADCKQASTTSTTSSGPSGSTCGEGGVCGCLPGYSGADCSHPLCLGTAVSRGSSGEFKSAANALSAQHLYANQADCLFVAEVGARFSFVRFNVTFDLEATFDELLVRAGGDGRVGVTNPWLLTSPRLAAEAGAASEAGRQDADGAVTYVRLSGHSGGQSVQVVVPTAKARSGGSVNSASLRFLTDDLGRRSGFVASFQGLTSVCEPGGDDGDGAAARHAQCSGHGACQEGSCACEKGWFGLNCAFPTCVDVNAAPPLKTATTTSTTAEASGNDGEGAGVEVGVLPWSGFILSNHPKKALSPPPMASCAFDQGLRVPLESVGLRVVVDRFDLEPRNSFDSSASGDRLLLSLADPSATFTTTGTAPFAVSYYDVGDNPVPTEASGRRLKAKNRNRALSAAEEGEAEEEEEVAVYIPVVVTHAAVVESGSWGPTSASGVGNALAELYLKPCTGVDGAVDGACGERPVFMDGTCKGGTCALRRAFEVTLSTLVTTTTTTTISTAAANDDGYDDDDTALALGTAPATTEVATPGPVPFRATFLSDRNDQGLAHKGVALSWHAVQACPVEALGVCAGAPGGGACGAEDGYCWCNNGDSNGDFGVFACDCACGSLPAAPAADAGTPEDGKKRSSTKLLNGSLSALQLVMLAAFVSLTAAYFTRSHFTRWRNERRNAREAAEMHTALSRRKQDVIREAARQSSREYLGSLASLAGTSDSDKRLLLENHETAASAATTNLSNLSSDAGELFDNLRYDVLTMSRGVTIQQRDPDSDDVTADRLWYMLEKAIAANPWMSYTLLSTVTVVCLTVLGALWYDASDKDADGDHAGTNDNWASGVYTAFQVFATGGIDGSITSVYQRCVYAAMVAFGLVFFSILIGFITDAVTSFTEGLRDGNSKVVEENHTLILGWNDTTAKLVVQIAFLRSVWIRQNETWARWLFPPLRVPPSSPLAASKIVLLNDSTSKRQMEEQLTIAFLEAGVDHRTHVGWDVVCRRGSPTNVHELVRVKAHKATSVMIMTTTLDSVEEEESKGKIKNGATIRALLALRYVVYANRRIKDFPKDLRVVVQLHSVCPYVESAEFLSPLGAQVVYPMDLTTYLNTLMFACASKPGLAGVITSILDFKDVAIRCRRASQLRAGPDNRVGWLVGKTFGEAMEGNRWSGSVLVGVVDKPRVFERGWLVEKRVVLQNNSGHLPPQLHKQEAMVDKYEFSTDTYWVALSGDSLRCSCVQVNAKDTFAASLGGGQGGGQGGGFGNGGGGGVEEDAFYSTMQRRSAFSFSSNTFAAKQKVKAAATAATRNHQRVAPGSSGHGKVYAGNGAFETSASYVKGASKLGREFGPPHWLGGAHGGLVAGPREVVCANDMIIFLSNTSMPEVMTPGQWRCVAEGGVDSRLLKQILDGDGDSGGGGDGDGGGGKRHKNSSTNSRGASSLTPPLPEEDTAAAAAAAAAAGAGAAAVARGGGEGVEEGIEADSDGDDAPESPTAFADLLPLSPTVLRPKMKKHSSLFLQAVLDHDSKESGGGNDKDGCEVNGSDEEVVRVVRSARGEREPPRNILVCGWDPHWGVKEQGQSSSPFRRRVHGIALNLRPGSRIHFLNLANTFAEIATNELATVPLVAVFDDEDDDDGGEEEDQGVQDPSASPLPPASHDEGGSGSNNKKRAKGLVRALSRRFLKTKLAHEMKKRWGVDVDTEFDGHTCKGGWLLKDYPGVSLYHSCGDPADIRVLRSVLALKDRTGPNRTKGQPVRFQSAIVMGQTLGKSEEEDEELKVLNIPKHSQDSRVLGICMLLRHLTKEWREPLHIVTENQEDQTSYLAVTPKFTSPTEVGVLPDFVNTQAIYARALCMALAYPQIQPAVQELLTEPALKEGASWVGGNDSQRRRVSGGGGGGCGGGDGGKSNNRTKRPGSRGGNKRRKTLQPHHKDEAASLAATMSSPMMRGILPVAGRRKGEQQKHANTTASSSSSEEEEENSHASTGDAGEAAVRTAGTLPKERHEPEVDILRAGLLLNESTREALIKASPLRSHHRDLHNSSQDDLGDKDGDGGSAHESVRRFDHGSAHGSASSRRRQNSKPSFYGTNQHTQRTGSSLMMSPAELGTNGKGDSSGLNVKGYGRAGGSRWKGGGTFHDELPPAADADDGAAFGTPEGGQGSSRGATTHLARVEPWASPRLVFVTSNAATVASSASSWLAHLHPRRALPEALGGMAAIPPGKWFHYVSRVPCDPPLLLPGGRQVNAHFYELAGGQGWVCDYDEANDPHRGGGGGGAGGNGGGGVSGAVKRVHQQPPRCVKRREDFYFSDVEKLVLHTYRGKGIAIGYFDVMKDELVLAPPAWEAREWMDEDRIVILNRVPDNVQEKDQDVFDLMEDDVDDDNEDDDDDDDDEGGKEGGGVGGACSDDCGESGKGRRKAGVVSGAKGRPFDDCEKERGTQSSEQSSVGEMLASLQKRLDEQAKSMEGLEGLIRRQLKASAGSEGGVTSGSGGGNQKSSPSSSSSSSSSNSSSMKSVQTYDAAFLKSSSTPTPAPAVPVEAAVEQAPKSVEAPKGSELSGDDNDYGGAVNGGSSRAAAAPPRVTAPHQTGSLGASTPAVAVPSSSSSSSNQLELNGDRGATAAAALSIPRGGSPSAAAPVVGCGGGGGQGKKPASLPLAGISLRQPSRRTKRSSSKQPPGSPPPLSLCPVANTGKVSPPATLPCSTGQGAIISGAHLSDLPSL